MSETGKEYKYTKQLLKIAIENGGYRNKDIAEKAGLSGKSVARASAWRNGRKNATERQMAYFIKEYEHLLRRKMEHIFYAVLLKGGEESPVFIKLSGEVIFKYQVKVARGNHILRNPKDFNVLRIVVLKEGNRYSVLYQYRAGLLDLAETEVDGTNQCVFQGIDPKGVVHSDNEEGNWYCYDFKRGQELDELVQLIQKYCRSLIKDKNLIDSAYSQSRSHDGKSRFFESNNIYPLELAFYQKMMSLNLSSEYFPF